MTNLATPLAAVTDPTPGRSDGPSVPADRALALLLLLRDQVAMHRRLRGEHIKVLLYILPEILDRRHRMVKQIVLARVLRMRQSEISKALALLVHEGLIERGHNEGTCRTYRVAPAFLARLAPLEYQS